MPWKPRLVLVGWPSWLEYRLYSWLLTVHFTLSPNLCGGQRFLCAWLVLNEWYLISIFQSSHVNYLHSDRFDSESRSQSHPLVRCQVRRCWKGRLQFCSLINCETSAASSLLDHLDAWRNLFVFHYMRMEQRTKFIQNSLIFARFYRLLHVTWCKINRPRTTSIFIIRLLPSKRKKKEKKAWLFFQNVKEEREKIWINDSPKLKLSRWYSSYHSGVPEACYFFSFTMNQDSEMRSNKKNSQFPSCRRKINMHSISSV